MIDRRRRSVALLLAGLLAIGGAIAGGEPPIALIDEGERLLASGDTDAAIAAFERAATTGHHVAIELALVRAYMQAGHYQRAAAAAAHAAGEHPDVSGAGGLHAWLLAVGGQREAAARVLADALVLHPDDPLLELERRSLAETLPVASGTLLDRPHRMAPSGGTVPDGAEVRVVTSAVLFGDGRHALAPRTRSVGPLWVRDGLGRVSEAWVDAAPAPVGFDGSVLCLARPLGPGLSMARGPVPFAGSPAVVVGFPSGTSVAPAWPVLRYGFLGRSTSADAKVRRLDVDVGPAAAGGIVFDASGRWIGLVVAGPEADGVAMASVTSAAFGEGEREQPKVAAASMATLYELGLRAVVQVIERADASDRSAPACAERMKP